LLPVSALPHAFVGGDEMGRCWWFRGELRCRIKMCERNCTPSVSGSATHRGHSPHPEQQRQYYLAPFGKKHAYATNGAELDIATGDPLRPGMEGDHSGTSVTRKEFSRRDTLTPLVRAFVSCSTGFPDELSSLKQCS
jgi:hypothetical protein